ILSTLLPRAYRRPVVEDDFATPMEAFREGRDAGGFE
ncbi:MAG: DUF1595 domain-containing protein, partial [Planctomycetaceae bacterium]|nr:DUF1595 domain-containing protein [Planctomycetaceae bacterium]